MTRTRACILSESSVVAFALPRIAAQPRAIDGGTLAPFLLLAAAFLIRLPQFGDPALMIDEQFYLLVGDRMLHGAIPFVDIWDRKPIGLFLIYAGCRLLGGAGFVQYQVVATLFAATTALLLYRLCRRTAGDGAGIVAGLLYLLWIEIVEGGGGQAPVFYTPFVAGAALLVLDAAGLADAGAFRRRAFAAMALIGVALQIKYSVVAEGLFFGIVLAIGTLRRASSAPRALVEVALLALTALAPTLLALACYAAIGQAHAFLFANFGSILLRAPVSRCARSAGSSGAMLRLVPLACAAAAGFVVLRGDARAETRRWQWLVYCWMASALAGFFLLKLAYAHYLLPVFAPFAAGAAPLLRRQPLGLVAGALLIWLPASHIDYPDFAATARRQHEITALTALIPPQVTRGCMLMFDGPPALYYTTRACFPTRFVFPDHLSAAIEAPAIGTDPRAELRRALARRPLVVTTSATAVRPPNRETSAILRAALRRDYVLKGRAPSDDRPIDIWVRRP